jgi:hypothetical protein
MICLIEGCDKTGKTTMAREFERRGYVYRHFSAPKGSPWQEYSQFLAGGDLATVLKRGGRVVLDRFHLGEPVYAKLYGRKSDLSAKRVKALDARLLRLGTVLVHATGPFQMVLNRLDEKTDPDGAQARRALDLFKKACAASRLPGFTYKIEEGDMRRCVDMVVRYHDALEEARR